MVPLKISVKGSNGTYSLDIQTINKCPYCGAFIRPHNLRNTFLQYKTDYILLSVFVAKCCDSHFFSCYSWDTLSTTDRNKTNYLFTYPNTYAADIPENLTALSPRFSDLYNQSYTAEQNGHFELAATGYRNAMEILVKDYAVVKLKKPTDEIVSKSLYKSIEAYMPSALLANGANVIRLLGNDFTHYENKYPQYDFEALKKFVNAFLSIMDAHLLLSEFPADLSKQPKNQ